MVDARRKPLHNLKYGQTDHAGLWLDRYLCHQLQRDEKLDQKKEKPLVTLMGEATSIPATAVYQSFYARWQQLLHDLGARYRKACVLGRMAVGLGDESVLETSVALHHTYGVPVIPGSALKGMAAHCVRDRLADARWGHWEGDCFIAGDAYRVIFGDTANAGYITFFDALYVPGSGFKGQALWPDVITVHHPKYYRGDNEPPADWDSPNPVPFLSATGSYLVALGGPEAWVERTFEILGHALQEYGVGAKTSSGYGRMALEGFQLHSEGIAVSVPDARNVTPATTLLPAAIDPDQSQIDELIARIEELPLSSVAGQINNYYQQWCQLAVRDTLKRQVAQAIIDKVAQADRVKTSAEKPWYRELVACVSTTPEQ